MSVVTVTVLSEGKAIDPHYTLVSVDIIAVLNRIPYACITLIDGNAAQKEFAASNSQTFEPGKNIEIKLRYEGVSASEKTVFTGLVISQSVEANKNNSLLKLILKDKVFQLTQIRKNQVYINQSDDQIIQKILSDHGLTVGDMAATQPKHPEIVQYDCTDWDFILSRADSNGRFIKVVNGSVALAEIKLGAKTVALDYGIDEIFSFEIEISAAGQYKAVSSSAWDIKNQQMSEPKQAKSIQLSSGNLDGGKLADSLGGETCALLNSAALAPEELQAWADAKMAYSRLELLRGRMSVPGRTDLNLLDTLEIKGIGERFNGNVLVTGLRHRVTDRGWITDIQFGLDAKWLLDTPGNAAAAISAASLLPSIPGLHIGLVAGFAEDPNKELRVKVVIPALSKTAITLWARLASPDAGKARGFYFRPEKDDEVVIGFINDDPRQPVIMGALYGSKNTPPQRFGAPSEKNSSKGLVSKKGCVISFDDEKASVSIETPGANKITLDDDAKSIRLADQHGNTFIMDENGITLKSAKDFKIEASGNVEIKGAKVDVK